LGLYLKVINKNKYNDSLLRLNTNNGKYLDFEFRENYLNIEVKLHTNMNNLNNVYVIESLNREEFKNISK
jgi:hypothetical protein